MTTITCIHCQEPIEKAPSYREIDWIHTSGYVHCQGRGGFLGTKAASAQDSRCCDGTGWTGDPHAPCAVHYEPLDAIWTSR